MGADCRYTLLAHYGLPFLLPAGTQTGKLEVIMGKHTTVVCWKCGLTVPRTNVSPTFGCRKCRPAAGTAEYLRLEDAGRATAGDRARVQWEAREEVEAQAMPVRASAPPMRRKQTPVETPAMDDLVARLVVEDRVVTAMNGVVARFARPRCSCCSVVAKGLTETEDGRLFCVLCAYGTLRTGHCSPHRTTHFPEVAATTVCIPAHEYPDDVLASQGLRQETFLPSNDVPAWMTG